MKPEAIEPGAAPGGLVFVHYVNGEIVLRQEMPKRERTPAAEVIVTASAEYAAEMTDGYVAAGATVLLHIYDGDTGVLVGSAIADRRGRRRLS